jgi:hypothetical protein
MRRRALFLSASLLAVFVAFLIAVNIGRALRPNFKDRFGFIHNGMTRREVEDVLGRPPGDYETVPHRMQFRCGGGGPHDTTLTTEEWSDDDGGFCVTFTSGGHTVNKRIESVGPPMTLWEQVEDWYYHVGR